MSQPQILIQEMSFNVTNSYSSSDKRQGLLFNNLNLVFSHDKTGLVGKNGIGKSILLKLIMGELLPISGSIDVTGKIAYVPQTCNCTQETIAEFLECEKKIAALHRIQQGSTEEHDFIILNEEWDIEDRIQKQLNMFGISTLSYNESLTQLSGGEVTRLMLIKAFMSDADFLLLDEPTNNLDIVGKQQLYNAIKQWQKGIIIASHDRELLNLMEEIIEITTISVNRYHGNYDNFREQKNILVAAKEQTYRNIKKTFHKTKNSIQSDLEKHEKRQSQGKKLRSSGSQPKILLDAMKNRSGQSRNALLIRHNRMLENVERKLLASKESIEIEEEIDVTLPDTYVPNGKIILEIENLGFSYPNLKNPIIEKFNLTVKGGERIALLGSNGSGKTTMVKLILGEIKSQHGKIYIGTDRISYLDQNVKLLNLEQSILENFLYFNPEANINDAYRCLANFLFRNIAAHNLAKNLSGGEKLRAMLACVLMSKNPPQLLILDEPTNHLDIQSIENIESILKRYQGTMIIISHDKTFLNNIGVHRLIFSPFKS